MGDEASPAVRAALGALTGLVGWVGASLAGLTALCYCAGYFVIHTHLSMLGLSDLVDVTSDQLLLEGGRFFYWTLEQLAIGWMIIIVIGTLAGLIARAVLGLPAIRASRAMVSIRSRLASQRAKSVALDLMPLAVIALVVWHFNQFYDPTNSILTLNNLLFSGRSHHDGTAAMIMSGNPAERASLVASYNFFVRVYALFVAVAWLVVYRHSITAFGKAASFLFVAYTVLLTAFLPQAFGVLVRAPYYPATKLTLKNGQQLNGLVVQRADRSILVWDPEGRRAVSIVANDVDGFEVFGERDIFEKERGK